MAERASRAPAIAASVLLHGAILGSTLIAWPWGTKLKPVEVTPVTLLTSEDIARLSAAAQSNVPAPAETPDPVAEAPPEPVAETPAPQPEPAAAPKPAPAQPAPQPAPAPKPTPAKTPAPAKPAPAATPTRARPLPTMDQIAASVAESARKPVGVPKASGRQGIIEKLETDFQSRKADGAATATAPDGRAMIAREIETRRLWRLNCKVPGISEVSVRIRIALNRDGSLAQRPQPADHSSLDAIPDPVVKAAASLAVSAVGAGAPYKGLPEKDYSNWSSFVLRFEGNKTCGSN